MSCVEQKCDRNFTADEAIAKIQGLTATTGTGRDYDAALWEGVNFLTTSLSRISYWNSSSKKEIFLKANNRV